MLFYQETSFVYLSGWKNGDRRPRHRGQAKYPKSNVIMDFQLFN